MIALLLGTNPFPFTRLLRAMDEWARRTGEKVVAQTGYTPVENNTLECHPFLPHADIIELISRADLVVCQGGFGSIRDALRVGKPIVAVPRMPDLRESTDHQRELVEALHEQGLVEMVINVDELGLAIDRARARRVRVSKESRIPNIVREIIDRVISAI